MKITFNGDPITLVENQVKVGEYRTRFFSCR